MMTWLVDITAAILFVHHVEFGTREQTVSTIELLAVSRFAVFYMKENKMNGSEIVV